MILYSVLYTSCIFESAYYTVSLHRTKLGAFKARQRLLREAYAEWNEERIMYGKPKFKFMEHEDCKLGEQEVFN